MISVIINYCSNERCFVDAMMKECRAFSDDIVVSYGSRLYDGTPEDLSHIEECKKRYPAVAFVEYEVDPTIDLSRQRGVVHRPKAYWHNLARWTAVRALKRHDSWVFVLDADEIPDGAQVKAWLERRLIYLKKNECYKIANHWYFKSPTLRAKQLEDSVLLIHRDYLTEDNIFGDNERDHLIPASKCLLKRDVRGLNGSVMWHHFSFVRSKKGLLHKLKHWGHSTENAFRFENLEEIVDKIFEDETRVVDFIHGYQYETVPNKFGLTV